MIPFIPFKKVRLSENCVPGSRLPDNPTVKQLKDFLKCHGYKTSGMRREELLASAASISKHQVRLSPSKDKTCAEMLAKRAKDLRNRDLNALENPPDVYPALGWKEFPSMPIPPKFNLLLIQQYLVDSAVVVDSESEEESFRDFGTSKPLLKGRIFFQSGHVLNLLDALSTSKKSFCLKGKVKSSMGKNNNAKIYNVLVMLEMSSGTVSDASCECKAKELQRCSHVGAVLFAVEDYTSKNGFFPTAPTSKTCSWNQGGCNKSPVQIYLDKYRNKRDPTRTIKTELDACKNQEENKILMLDLALDRSLFPDGTKWDTSLSYSYSDYTVDEERIEVLKSLRCQLEESLKFGLNAPGVVHNTVTQSLSEYWVNIRRLLVTASVISSFVNVTEENAYIKLRDHLWFPLPFSSKYTDYGKAHENEAKRAYSILTGNIVEETGLWINPSYPGLAASPDGVVYGSENQTNIGILEIKCPYKLRNLHPQDFMDLSKKQLASFCLQREGQEIKLKRSHQYYKQIQMQMGIVGAKWGDFVVWSKKGLVYERILFDENLWQSLSVKLRSYHHRFLSIEFFEMRTVRNLTPLCLE